jgi:hypothetical protein
MQQLATEMTPLIQTLAGALTTDMGTANPRQDIINKQLAL